MTIAAVCRRGHTVTLESSPGAEEGFCTECGAKVIRNCESCSNPIPGLDIDEVDAFGNLDWSAWERPTFCPSCGAPFPWLDRQARLYEIENRLGHDDLSRADQLALREELEALADPGLSEKEQARHWKRIRELAPNLADRAGDLLQDLATEYVKRKAGLG